MRPLFATTLVLTSLLATQPAWADDAEAFREAITLYQQGKCEEAMPTFERLAEDSPNARLFVARCHRKAGRLDVAYEEMQRTFNDAAARAVEEKRFDETRRHAADELEALQGLIARVTVLDAERLGTLSIEVGGRALGPDDLGRPRAYLPGELTIRATAPNRAPYEETIRVAAGDERSVAITLPPVEAPPASPTLPPSPPEPPPALPFDAPPSQAGTGYLVGGIVSSVVTLGGVGMWVGGWLRADSTFDELEAECGTSCTAPDQQDRISEGELFDTVATVGIVVTGVGAAASVLCFTMYGLQDEPVKAAILPYPGGATLRAQF